MSIVECSRRVSQNYIADVLLTPDKLYDQFEEGLSLAGMTREVVSYHLELTSLLQVGNDIKAVFYAVFSIELIILKLQVHLDISAEENRVDRGTKDIDFGDTRVF